MDDTVCRRFFLEPAQLLHRRYLALRTFFVDGLSYAAIGEQVGVTYHTVRSWVRDFRAQCQAGQLPPFSPNRTGADRPARPRRAREAHGQRSQPRPTSAC